MKWNLYHAGQFSGVIPANFVLIMCNTGMRPTEAKNLRWRDVAIRADAQGSRSLPRPRSPRRPAA